MQQGPPAQMDIRGIVYREIRQILSVSLRTTASQRIMAITAGSALSQATNLEFCGEFFNPPNQPNFLFAKSGHQSGNNPTILGTPQFGFETLRVTRDALKSSF
jgi:hypothetical protein